MKKQFIQEAPPPIKDFLMYLQNIQGRSPLTIDEYYSDLRTFFRYILQHKGLADSNAQIEDISIAGVDIELIRSVTADDIFDFFILPPLADERHRDEAVIVFTEIARNPPIMT